MGLQSKRGQAREAVDGTASEALKNDKAKVTSV